MSPKTPPKDPPNPPPENADPLLLNKLIAQATVEAQGAATLAVIAEQAAEKAQAAVAMQPEAAALPAVDAQIAAVRAVGAAQMAADAREKVISFAKANNDKEAQASAKDVTAEYKEAGANAELAQRKAQEAQNTLSQRQISWQQNVKQRWVDNLQWIRLFAGIIALLLILGFILSQPSLRDFIGQNAGVILLVVALAILLYQPSKRIPVRYTLSPKITSAGEEPSLPFTHPAVLVLGLYIMILTLLCLGLVLEIGPQVSAHQPTPTPSASSTATKTPDANSTPVPQTSAVKADSLNLAAQATPGATPTATSEATAETTASPGTDTTSSNTTPAPTYTIHLLSMQIEVTLETRLLLLIVLSGALGGLLKAIQSYRAYLGENNFKGSWILYYVTEPFVGGVLALVFYVVIRGGLFSSESITSTNTNTFGLVATSGLIGLFNGQAMKKLKQVAETVFTVNVSQNPLKEDKDRQEKEKQPPASPPPNVVVGDTKTGMVAAVVQQDTTKDDTGT